MAGKLSAVLTRARSVSCTSWSAPTFCCPATTAAAPAYRSTGGWVRSIDSSCMPQAIASTDAAKAEYDREVAAAKSEYDGTVQEATDAEAKANAKTDRAFNREKAAHTEKEAQIAQNKKAPEGVELSLLQNAR